MTRYRPSDDDIERRAELAMSRYSGKVLRDLHKQAGLRHGELAKQDTAWHLAAARVINSKGWIA